METNLQNGKLQIGCNYWASHAGTEMWKEWRPDIIEKDFALLEKHGLTLVRVFPLWLDFQPVYLLRGCAGRPKEYAWADGTPLPMQSDGLLPEMLDRFRILADLAQKYHLKLVVALLTGWMSGRLMVPPVLEGLNLLTDSEALRWEGRFIRGFINALKDHPAIIAWEPGNECNCLSSLNSSTGNVDSAHWLDFIAASIRSYDSTRPVWSGMHGGSFEQNGAWNLFDQGEYYDALTTHPYPAFTPYCGRSALNTIPAIFHSTAETLFYRGISGKPAFIEEIGSFGPVMLSEERRCGYIQATLASAWVHNCLGYLWWCGFHQTHLTHAPYRWIAMERELGLFDTDGVPLPGAKVFSDWKRRVEALPFTELPPRKVHAVVLLTPGQDQWQIAYGTFILAKQAGIEVEFSSPYAPLPDAELYLMPSVQGHLGLPRDSYYQLMEKVRNGAFLYVSDAGNSCLQPFSELFGCEVDYTSNCRDAQTFSCEGEVYSLVRPFTRKLLAGTSEVLAVEEDGTPMLTSYKYGKGQAVFLNAAPELSAVDESVPHSYLLYRKIAVLAGLDLPEKAPEIGRTEHPWTNGRTIVVEINYSDKESSGLAANDFRVTIR